ncbi:MAG: tetratricopeptide repeat protein [Candidatus Tritonobacter lacicola]|nr:tetratricopeptide repeat protein [Candidatus Tritonobacter lacicola]
MVQLFTIRANTLPSILTIVFISALATLASADYDAGLVAYKRGDYAAATREWLPLAEKGNAKAQNAIGLMYAEGKGFPQGYIEAVKWYRKSAEGGYPSAMHNLGFMYANGEGLTQDFGEAAKWYRMAAERGHHAAQHKLSQLYAEGKGVSQDYIQAYTWLLITNCKQTEELKLLQSIASRLNAEQIAAAKKNASEWKPKK